jgi:hypothetical protein
VKDDAAKIIIYILGVAIAVGLLVMLGHYLIVGEAYTPEYCFESNKEAGFYPYVSPRRELNEGY